MHHKVNIGHKGNLCECVCGCVCVELAADLSGLLTLSLYENNASRSRRSHGTCTLTTTSYCTMTWTMNTKKVITYIHSGCTSDIHVDTMK